jgi:hypothetical protein
MGIYLSFRALAKLIFVSSLVLATTVLVLSFSVPGNSHPVDVPVCTADKGPAVNTTA